MKNDLISRQAAIDAIVNTVSEIGLHDNSEVARYGATFMQHEIIDIIEGMPSAQPKSYREGYQAGFKDAQPEIIRCRDCKWHRFDKDNIPYCYNIDYGYGWKDDDFCSRAERREDNK